MKIDEFTRFTGPATDYYLFKNLLERSVLEKVIAQTLSPSLPGITADKAANMAHASSGSIPA
jgi:hypothetical protein